MIRRAISPRLATSTLVSERRHGYILKTPKRREPSQTSLIVADSAIPSTVRVSRGSMMPSSQSSPLATSASDSASIWSSTAFVPAAERLLVDLEPRRSAPGPHDDLHDAGELLGAHHRDLVVRPAEDEPRLEARPHIP